MKKIAKELVAGDKIKMGDGEFAKVTNVSKGFVRYEGGSSVMVIHTHGWSQIPASMEVTVAPTA